MQKSASTSLAAAVACVAGAALAAVLLAYWRRRQESRFSKKSHPGEWAVWARVDGARKGVVSAIRSLCYRFESDEHAEVLAKLLDPWSRDRITFHDFVNSFEAVQMMRTAARLKLWHRCCGIGVAGNVAGHMARAGEADEHSVATAPAAIFTYYLPPHPFVVQDMLADKQRLEHFPVTYAVILLPKIPGACKVQIEPEMGLYADIVYSVDRSRVERLVPRRVAAFNDCSIRSLEGASKLSQKKNWGFGSKGISLRSFPIDSFAPGSFVDNLALVAYFKRDMQVYQYTVNAPVRNYLMFHEPLLEWIVECINVQSSQTDTDKSEEVFTRLAESDYPTSTWIALGAGEYTQWGQQNYLQPADETVIMIYDERIFPEGPSSEELERQFNDLPAPEGIVALHQTFL
ncbi:unnamed protein product [Polarella glacialis]|uniref:Uncharacterized protein n=1 Tax=Polarella glacialis TaxID=89957 RepID=A0A813LF58_POLGL|nr:unnamed protein product [Polarella glacialis]